MRRFQPFFTLVIFALWGASSASGQASQPSVISFTSDGTGPEFSDLLDSGNPDAVDFHSVTSGQVTGLDATLTIFGSGTTTPTYWNDGTSFYTDASLDEASVTLQYNTGVTPDLIESLQGPLRYEFVTSHFFPEKLTLSGILTDAQGHPQNFFFVKNVDPAGDGDSVIAEFVPVPELTSSVHFVVMLCFTLAACVWNSRRRPSA